MFPFNLPGPSFLAAYAGISAVVLFGFWFYARSGAEAGGAARLGDLTADPYKIGFLRGAEEEAVRLAIVNLVDRGILGCAGTMLAVSDKANADLLRRPLDRAIVARCARPASLKELVADRSVVAACAAYERELADAGLLRGPQRQNAVLMALLGVLGLLGGLAIARLLQALSHGRHNVFFLVVIAIGACWFAHRIYSNRLTFAGVSKIRSLQTLMARLKARANALRSGGATNEALLVAAIFGLAALPASAFPFIEQVFPRPRSSDGSSGSWNDSSSCGSSSGGSSCGGGGGSGCGGCGGGGD